ncbi:hypothetical protein [Streptomyces albidochromogenes]|uniref:Uncharacterized protein n=1 Tax=Streptomyces albidochromogenes TaxID=329524 RepID=A0ABW6FJM7_9ACTN
MRRQLTATLLVLAAETGRRAGNLHRPKRYSHRLHRVLYKSDGINPCPVCKPDQDVG